MRDLLACMVAQLEIRCPEAAERQVYHAPCAMHSCLPWSTRSKTNSFANDTDDPRKVVAIFAYKVLWTDTVCNFEKPAARPDPADILTLLC